MNIYELRTEYEKSPRFLFESCPRFSWKIQSDKNDTIQESYKIVVSKKREDGIRDEVWNSGTVVDSQSVHVEYAGTMLQSETEYKVELTVTDNHGETANTESCFSTTVLDVNGFTAKMIVCDIPKEDTACPVFYQSFTTEKKVNHAYAYATAHGVYEMTINGKKVGNLSMTPGFTSYKNRLQFQSYDITDLLGQENMIEIAVGNGWYKGVFGFMMQSNIYGNKVGAFSEIHVFYEDGTVDVIATDKNWKARSGQITASEIYYGETRDTTLTAFNEYLVTEVDFDKVILIGQENEPVRVTERIKPINVFKDNNGDWLVDFGQNLTGVVELSIKGDKGQKVVISHAETLDKYGNFYPMTLRSATSVDTFILDGSQQTLTPKFTFHGFRYAKIEGIHEPTAEMFTANVMHSDMELIGSFHSSNEKVNQLHSNITWGFRDNFLDIPTDCPQRDERLGWTGDAQVFSWTASQIRNTARFFSKWLKDMAAESSLEKGVPHVVPDILDSYSSSAWSDAATIIPWCVYQTYGDKRILENSYKMMHEWVDYIHNNCQENGLWQTGFQYGDWLALDKEEMADRTGATDKYLVANAYYLYSTEIVINAAKVLGLYEEVAKYTKLYNDTLETFRDEYFTKTGRIVSETQTGAVIALHFGLAREKDRARIFDTLITNLANHKNHLVTGFVGTPYINHVLSENGAHDIASILFMREDFPSWLYAVNMGATTIWERWNSITPEGDFDLSGMNSLNHYAYGSIGDWMYRKISGISQLEPGYKKFKVAPMFVDGIYQSDRVFETMYGKIESHVSCRNNEINFKVVVPANTSAVIVLPETGETFEVGSGTYEYKYHTDRDLTVAKFSLNSTLAEILNQPLAVEMFNQMAPGMLDGPMIQFAYQMEIAEMLGAAPDAKPMFEAVIAALNAQEIEKP
ncbi:glycoside hydrolase family 78 protein [Lachnospiraceae bacterium OttesenSCG-928-D06]|nr:glycoside hydrolase family 78 protein [Lachnospiraceae bacterium OttesenSCG-928-D06]